YYAKGPGRTGRSGDFFTSVSTGPVFGELLAGQFYEVWEQLGRPAAFTVVERGASDGAFARDVLTWASAERPDFAAALHYRIDEPLAALEAAQREALAEFGDRVQWGMAEGVTGVFFANELLDAIPFRRVRWTGSQWRELSVGLDGAGNLTWVETEPLDRATVRRLAALGMDFPAGYTTEIAPAVASEMRLAASSLKQGVLFLIDYGYTSGDYYHPGRTTGTLRCYRAHKAHEDPFDAVGETDITAHVDFSFAARAAVAAGCTVAGFLDQGRFLTGAAAATLSRMEGRAPDARASKWLRQFQTLSHPGQMGRSFHVLALGKSLPPDFQLSGLKHARAQDADKLLQGKP
ncbi:MAG TPA: SAM-dependent methyltransferase, partial [Verrucomicrobiales bacterium]|nr:SAM-dependent methyltransferase [Verrucomicrobiales bacterium]